MSDAADFAAGAHMIVIGLTGGIGTGKTEVARILRGLGAAVVDAHLAAHEVYSKGSEGWAEIVGAFGEGLLTAEGSVDRPKLAALVFEDAAALARLNSIVHPRARSIVETELERLREEGTGVAVVEAPLLLEAGWTDMVDRVWVTVAPPSQAVERAAARSRLAPREVEARAAAQMPQQERTALADVVIDNGAGIRELERTVEAEWRSLTKGTREEP